MFSGNSDPTVPGDWTPIIVSNAPTPPEQGNSAQREQIQEGICPNVVLSMHVEVVYANIGAVANPQAKILGTLFTAFCSVCINGRNRHSIYFKRRTDQAVRM